MTITYVAAGTVLDTAAGPGSTLQYPAGIATGDLLIAFGVLASGAGTAPDPTSTLTWTQVANRTNFQKVWVAVYDGVATAPTMTGGNAEVYQMHAIRGADPVTPSSGFASTAVTQTNMRYPGLTISNNGSAVFTFCKANAAITSVAQTAGFTEVLDRNATSAGMGVQIQYQIQTTATSISQTDPVVTGGSSVTQTGITVAFNALSAPAVINPLPQGARQTFVTETIIQF